MLGAISVPDTRLTRIGVFFDGGYFQAVSDYYRYSHEQKARLSIDGLLRFAEHRVAEAEAIDERYCRVVDSHYFRGRFSVEKAIERGKLEHDRRFDDLLMRAGVVTHYLPRGLSEEEKGIDVWFALEAFELAVYKRFNVLVLVACDGDYVPLIRKLNTLGTRVMLLAWDFRFFDPVTQRDRETRTSQALIEAVTYPVMMHDLIDDRSKRKDPRIAGLFYRPQPRPEAERPKEAVKVGEMGSSGRVRGRIKALKEGYGFIAADTGEDRFFSYVDVLDIEFDELEVGDAVEFLPRPGKIPGRSEPATEVRRI